jgi:hypothetical protein
LKTEGGSFPLKRPYSEKTYIANQREVKDGKSRNLKERGGVNPIFINRFQKPKKDSRKRTCRRGGEFHCPHSLAAKTSPTQRQRGGSLSEIWKRTLTLFEKFFEKDVDERNEVWLIRNLSPKKGTAL